MTIQSESEPDHFPLPAGISHSLEVIEFLAENQPLDGEQKYNAVVRELADRLRRGEIDLATAKANALGALIDETFGGAK